MPKMKSKRGAAKRFKISGTGKVIRHRANTNHILTTKKRKRKRQLKRSAVLGGKNAKSIRTLVKV